ncbi:flippase [Acinetobacter lwoffii]|uniref:flippase n=1 Tax=Acinetobacter lwoffii TaxID=28090 RepID=UPI0032B57FC4
MSLIKNSTYNIVGFVIPVIIAIPALGVISRQLGVENFGLFTLAFAIVGYASIFDGGITRAVIREIAIYRKDIEEQKRIISTASVLVIFLGIFASLILFFGASYLADFLKISIENVQQAKISFELLAFILPVYLINQVWLAYLEGHERFININIQRIVSSILISLLPVVFCFYEPNLISAIIGLIAARYMSLIVTLLLCRKIIFSSGFKFHKVVFKRLIKFGSWLTVSNLISPIMVYFDRFLISNYMGANKVAFYAAPAEMVSRLNNIPYALTRALFPKLIFSTDLIEKKRLENLSYLLISLICLAIFIFCFFFTEFILVTWLGPEYKGEAVIVFQVLLVGFYFNSIAQIPYSLLQANGHSRTTALIHLAEIIPYILVLFILLQKMGILGASIAWTARCILDFFLMYFFSKK